MEFLAYVDIYINISKACNFFSKKTVANVHPSTSYNKTDQP